MGKNLYFQKVSSLCDPWEGQPRLSNHFRFGVNDIQDKQLDSG